MHAFMAICFITAIVFRASDIFIILINITIKNKHHIPFRKYIVFQDPCQGETRVQLKVLGIAENRASI
jgi:hypothetical protein